MARTFYCSSCGNFLVTCGHAPGNLITGKLDYAGKCGRCLTEYSVSCAGDCQ